MVSVDHYINQIGRGFECGYIRLGSDPDYGVGPARQPPWELKIAKIRYPDPNDYRRPIRNRKKQRRIYVESWIMGEPVWKEYFTNEIIRE